MGAGSGGGDPVDADGVVVEERLPLHARPVGHEAPEPVVDGAVAGAQAVRRSREGRRRGDPRARVYPTSASRRPAGGGTLRDEEEAAMTPNTRRPGTVRRWLARCAALAVVAVAATASANVEPLQPLVSGWEQYFTLSWEPAERAGRPIVRGRIQNEWGFPATDIRLLVEGFDGTGRLVGQSIGWLGTQLPPGIYSHFEVPVREAAASYRVSVFAFSWVQAGNGGDNR
jgi:hypothetical protein